MDLDKDQKEAVQAGEERLCIIAGPGSGKTRTIVERIAFLLENGTRPGETLAITFTTKAARELRERLAERTDGEQPDVHTFHSFAYELLRTHHPEELSLLTEKEQREVVSGIVKDMKGMIARRALACLSLAKSRPEIKVRGEEMKELFERYEQALRERGKMDFDDILIRAVRLFGERPDLRDKYARKYKHVLIDEFQDTNAVQMALMRSFIGEDASVAVIGDPRQAIYGFRGGVREAFDLWKSGEHGVRDIRLTTNYRSAAPIQAVSRALFGDVHEDDSSGTDEPVRLVRCPTARAEAAYVAREIEKLCGGLDMGGASGGEGYHLGDIAIIYRLNAIGRECERELEHVGIPFHRLGRDAYFDRPEVREVLDRLKKKDTQVPLKEALGACIEEVCKGNEDKYARAAELLWIAEPHSTREPLDAHAAFFAEIELSREDDERPGKDMVVLLSAHAAKGLEFKAVFVLGCEEGLFPYLRDGEDEERIEEERRLLYVAFTRAKERLYIMQSGERTIFGEKRSGTPSRFLSGLPQRCTREETVHAKAKKSAPQMRLF